MIEYENLSEVNKIHKKNLKKIFSDSLESGQFILGNNTLKFEQEFSNYTKSKYSCGVASGLDSMILSLKSQKFEKGSQVIVPSNTYIATILAVLRSDLVPVLAEPKIGTYNICPHQIEEKINNKTKAVIVTHLYGNPCEMESIVNICNKNKLVLLEDCAQSHGATYRGKHTGTFGKFGCFSFYPTKNLGALGDGGLITVKNKKDLNHLQNLRNYGSSIKYKNSEIGFNSRLDEIQAAFLRIKLRSLNKLINHKQKLASIYHKELKDDFIKPKLQPHCKQVFHIYPIRHPKRNKLREYLLENGVKTDIHYPIPPHKQKGYISYLKGNYPISEKIHETILSLPISLMHKESEINKICEILNKF